MKYFVFLVLIFLNTLVFSKKTEIEKYCISFTNKQGVDFNPYRFFDIKAIERRMREGLELYDTTDFPVREDYIKTITSDVDEVRAISRWLNAMIVMASENQISAIEMLPFVKKVEKMPLRKTIVCSKTDIDISADEEFISKMQTLRMEGDIFRKHHFDGSGIRIAITDIGFKNVDSHDAFTHLFSNKQIIKTRNFHRNTENVYKAHSHGTSCLSCIAGIYNDTPLGLATGAEFLLAITETRFELYSEEEMWLMAAEWADQNGADIISNSLGYTRELYFSYQMDGRQSIIAKAASIAASKGILIVTSMGNEGDDNWKIVATPADTDSILSVGGIDPNTDYHISFSSFGPTADKRIKPNVVSYGKAFAAVPSNDFSLVEGTSFSAPLVAGFAACAWQANRNLKMIELLRKIEQSGDLYPYYDYAHGYGVPQASFFIDTVKPTRQNKVSLYTSNDDLYVSFDETCNRNEKYQNQNYLYFHIRSDSGTLIKYKIFRVFSTDSFKIASIDDIPQGSTVMVYFRGAFYELKL